MRLMNLKTRAVVSECSEFVTKGLRVHKSCINEPKDPGCSVRV